MYDEKDIIDGKSVINISKYLRTMIVDCLKEDVTVLSLCMRSKRSKSFIIELNDGEFAANPDAMDNNSRSITTTENSG